MNQPPLLLPTGKPLYDLVCRLFPICRSLTGDGVRQTLQILSETAYGLKIYEIPTGTQCFDWVIPREWNINAGWIEGPDGKRIVDFNHSNLHVVGYSIPVDTTLSLDELDSHLHSLPEQPDAIPYVTSYYKERWGFCLTDRQRKGLKPGRYRVKIDSELKSGSLTYAEIVLSGLSREEVFLSTYVCHPSLGNNELSGPVVTAFLAAWLSQWRERRYTYRIVFVPETIGSIAYLSRHLDEMKKNMVAGFNVTCVGDDRTYSYLPSRRGDTLADQVVLHVLKHTACDFQRYSYLDRGSDERQYCSPGADLPVATLMRSKYAMYPEYHTSLDNLSFVNAEGLYGGYLALARCIECLEKNFRPRMKFPGEPQLGKRGLYPDLGIKMNYANSRLRLNLSAYADGTHSLLEIAELLGVPFWELNFVAEELIRVGILEAPQEGIKPNLRIVGECA